MITQCFWDKQTGGPNNGLGTALATELMHQAGTFIDAGWDFVNETANGTEDIWYIYEDVSYPLLRWQNNRPGACIGDDQIVYAGHG